MCGVVLLSPLYQHIDTVRNFSIEFGSKESLYKVLLLATPPIDDTTLSSVDKDGCRWMKTDYFSQYESSVIELN